MQPLIDLAEEHIAHAKVASIERTEDASRDVDMISEPGTRHDVDSIEKAISAMERKLASLPKRGAVSPGPSWNEHEVKMNNSPRNEIARLSASADATRRQRINLAIARREAVCATLSGWQVADESAFSPAPIGCLNGMLPDVSFSQNGPSGDVYTGAAQAIRQRNDLDP